MVFASPGCKSPRSAVHCGGRVQERWADSATWAVSARACCTARSIAWRSPAEGHGGSRMGVVRQVQRRDGRTKRLDAKWRTMRPHHTTTHPHHADESAVVCSLPTAPHLEPKWPTVRIHVMSIHTHPPPTSCLLHVRACGALLATSTTPGPPPHPGFARYRRTRGSSIYPRWMAENEGTTVLVPRTAPRPREGPKHRWVRASPPPPPKPVLRDRHPAAPAGRLAT